MKSNQNILLLLLLFVISFQNRAFSQYRILDSRELEELRKESQVGASQISDVAIVLELQISVSLLEKDQQTELNGLVHKETFLLFSNQLLKVVVKENYEKSEYALIKNWLYDNGITISEMNRFYALIE